MSGVSFDAAEGVFVFASNGTVRFRQWRSSLVSFKVGFRVHVGVFRALAPTAVRHLAE